MNTIVLVKIIGLTAASELHAKRKMNIDQQPN